jgi:hypothetical protein
MKEKVQKFRKIKEYRMSDDRQTPIEYCKFLINYFEPSGTILEPFKGNGNFYNIYPKNCKKEWCEIKKGKDFFDFNEKVDWIITNPPFILITKTLEHCVEIADNFVLIFSYHYMGSKYRFRLLKENDFWIKDILLIPTPKEWGTWGIQMAVYHFKKNYSGDTKIKLITQEEIDFYKSKKYDYVN